MADETRRPDDQLERRYQRLRRQVERQARRMKQADEDRPTLLAQTVFLGTLGLLFVLPVVGGAYLGRWLDSLLAGYSVSWTVSFLLLGIVLGAANVYLFLKSMR
jgi:ATP synthase protein I